MRYKSQKLTIKNENKIHVTDAGEITLKCPACGKRKPLTAFGLRQMKDGSVRNQPWCRECR
jgi:hypothetical protein